MDGNHKLNLSSVKKAKLAIQKWKGKKLRGYCHFQNSLKLCNLLGLSVNYEKGTAELIRKFGTGF
jgi:hypothetical protein